MPEPQEGDDLDSPPSWGAAIIGRMYLYGGASFVLIVLGKLAGWLP
jgi:hypothetical protein